MINLTWIFIGVVVLFFIILGVRDLFSKKNKEKICTICFAFGLTWIFLIGLYWFGNFGDKTIIALMMGMTLLGIFYLWERNVGERVLIFRLPLLLTSILIGYSLLEGFSYGYSVVIFLVILWGFFGIIFLYNGKNKARGFVKKLVGCCKKW